MKKGFGLDEKAISTSQKQLIFSKKQMSLQ